MLEEVKVYLLNHMNEVGYAIVGVALIASSFIPKSVYNKPLNTLKILGNGLGEILATLIVMPVTVAVITLELVVNILTVMLTICTGVITVGILTVNLLKTLLQDLTTYIVKNYGEESK